MHPYLFYFRTCYFVLGLIAKTQQGVELLGEIGWESVVSPNGESEGLCVPLNLSRFLTVIYLFKQGVSIISYFFPPFSTILDSELEI